MAGRLVTILDYGVGNLRSVARAFEKCGATAVLTESPEEAARADRLVVPGVGAFKSCIDALTAAGFREVVGEFVAQSDRPVLGICVGMQMLFDESTEFGNQAGLALLPGTVSLIPKQSDDGARRKVPHIGWAQLSPPEGRDWQGTVLESTPAGSSVYFVHSYSAHPKNEDDTLAVTDCMGYPVCAAVRQDNLMGMQFHPEKSGQVGLNILRSFIDL